MSDIGSDSDATIADSIEEDDGGSSSSSNNTTIGYAECALSLQAGQKQLFEKFDKVTAETTTVQYVQGLQEDYLVLEESLCQLSNITRLERKQLSNELEVASATGKSDRSFQQQLLQLSDKQKTLLQCFDNQKILGSQLKILISSQNRYSTRSKTSLRQVHSQEYTLSSYHSNNIPLSTKVEAPKVAIITTSHFTPFRPVQPSESSLKLPSSTQLTTAIVRKTVLHTSKANSLGITKQKKLVAKNQQSQSATTQKFTSVGVAQQAMGVTPQLKHVGGHQQPVGVDKQAVYEVTAKQAVETQLIDAVTKSQCPVTVILHQQKTVGVAMQQPLYAAAQPIGMDSAAGATTQKQPVGMTTQQSAVDVATQHSAAGVSTQQQPVGVTTQHSEASVATQQQPVGVTTQHSETGVSTQQQPVGVTTQHSEASVATQQQPVGVATQHSETGVATQQQPVGMTTQHSEASVATQQQPVGVATQHSETGVATQQQPVGMTTKQSAVGVAIQQKQKSAAMQHQSLDAIAQPVGVATQHSAVNVMKHQQPVGLATQKQPVGVIMHSVGVAMQKHSVGVAMQKQPVSVATENQQMEIDIQQPQSVGGATQHSQPVDKGKHTVSMQQPRGVATKQPMRLLLHSELAQPVPLDVLLQHQLISPQNQCLSCTLMGCQFVGSLATDGSIISQDGRKFPNPPQWLNNCWATLGHSKRVDRRTAYSKVNYKDKSLLHYCLIYSQQKVTNYLSRSHDHMLTNKTTPLTDKTNKQPEDMIDMTEKHWICPISDHELVLSSEWLPMGFWESSNTVIVNSDIENDVNF